MLDYPNYPNGPGDAPVVLAILRQLCETEGHQFWSDDISLRDALEPHVVITHVQVTDLLRLRHHPVPDRASAGAGFIYYPALLFQGTWPEILQAVLSGGVGVIALAAGLEGYFLRRAHWVERGLFLTAALLLIHPGLVTDLAGLSLLGVGLALQALRPAEPAVAAG